VHIVEGGSDFSTRKNGWIVGPDGKIVTIYERDPGFYSPGRSTSCGAGTCLLDIAIMAFTAEGLRAGYVQDPGTDVRLLDASGQLAITEKTTSVSNLETYYPNGEDCAVVSCLRGTF
jgi:hypothetical protein